MTSTPAVRLEPMRESDWPEVARIYREGIESGDATFETEVPSRESWDRAHLPEPRLIARAVSAEAGPGDPVVGARVAEDPLLGWAALSRVSDRCVYGGVAEVSVYVSAAARGRGVGRRLLEELVAASERAGLWTLQAGVFQENGASVKLHEACGFRVVGRRERLGKLGGVWRDVLLMERRSVVTGV